MNTPLQPSAQSEKLIEKVRLTMNLDRSDFHATYRVGGPATPALPVVWVEEPTQAFKDKALEVGLIQKNFLAARQGGLASTSKHTHVCTATTSAVV